MRSKAQWKETRLGGAIGTLFAAVLGLALLFYGAGNSLVRLSFDLPFILRPTAKPAEAVVIYMDENSHRALGQPYFAPWDRRIHAALLRKLQAHAVKAVAFDILFDTPTTNDTALAEAAGALGDVVLGARFLPVGAGGLSHWDLRLPTEQLRAVAAWGVAESPDEDDVVRRHYRVARHSTNVVSLAWRTAEISGIRPLPDPLVARYLNYYGPPGTIPWCSYVDVLSNNVPSALLSNKVVFVGARVVTGFTGGKGTDDFPTPYSRWIHAKAPGVEINATACLNLIRGEWLSRLSPVAEFALVLAAAIVFGFGLALFPPLIAAVLAAAAAILVSLIAALLMWQQLVWFPWAILSLAQIPCAAISAALFHARRMSRGKAAVESQPAAAPSRQASAAFEQAPPALLLQAALRARAPQESGTPTAQASDTSPQSPIVPDCTLLRRIGNGAYGEVWLGVNVVGGFRAVKIVHRDAFSDSRPYEREFEGIRHFDPISRNHPGLVHLLQVGRNDEAGYFYYVMELADDAGGNHPIPPETYQPKTLRHELQSRTRLSLNDCLRLGIDLTDALEYLHRHNLIHRDIKPSNLIYVGGRLKLADIGLVTQIGEERTSVGTRGFSPPEGPGSPAGDVYSLGKVLYEAFTGFNQQRFPELPSELAKAADAARRAELNKIILRACEHDTERRYATAGEMRKDLLRLTRARPSLWKLLGQDRSPFPS